MLSQIKRISKQKEFDLIFKEGKSYFSPCLNLKILPIGERSFKLAIVVSAKVAKKAVDRNKIRRRIKEIVRKIAIPGEKGWALMIIAKPEIAGCDFKRTKEILEKLLQKAGL